MVGNPTSRGVASSEPPQRSLRFCKNRQRIPRDLNNEDGRHQCLLQTARGHMPVDQCMVSRRQGSRQRWEYMAMSWSNLLSISKCITSRNVWLVEPSIGRHQEYVGQNAWKVRLPCRRIHYTDVHVPEPPKRSSRFGFR